MRIFNLITLFIVCSAAGHAQKLPNKQEASIWAPADIKIDGKADEWNNQFQAYNSSVDLYYTIANNDSLLYLGIRAEKPRIILKALSVGFCFTVYDNKNNFEAVSYPVISLKDGALITKNLGIKPADIIPHKVDVVEKFIPGKSDSLLAIVNNILQSKAAKIRWQEKGSPDTSIIENNADDIRFAARFDSEGHLVYELAIPLKLLNISISGTKKIKYNIKLLSRTEIYKTGIGISYSYNSAGEPYDTNQDLNSTTDFSGEYILAKKP